MFIPCLTRYLITELAQPLVLDAFETVGKLLLSSKGTSCTAGTAIMFTTIIAEPEYIIPANQEYQWEFLIKLYK